MLRDQRIAVVVPARNEARHIDRVLQTMPAYVDHVVVVDDGSTDDTGQRVRAHRDPRVTLVSHERPLGVGGALCTGYQVAFEKGAMVAAVMAGDGQMDPADLESLLMPVLAGHVGYAKGNRLAHPELACMPRARRLGNRALSWLTRAATGLHVGDSQCGYTALSHGAHAMLPWRRVWRGYGYPNDLLGWLSLYRVPVCDVQVRPVYRDEQSGIGLRHALLVIPSLLCRVLWRRVRVGAVGMRRAGGASRLTRRPAA